MLDAQDQQDLEDAMNAGGVGDSGINSGGLAGGIGGSMGGPVGGMATGAGPTGAVQGGSLGGTAASPSQASPVGGVGSAAPAGGMSLGGSAGPVGTSMGGQSIASAVGPSPAQGMTGPSPMGPSGSPGGGGGGFVGAGLSSPAVGGLAGLQSGLKADFGGPSLPSSQVPSVNSLGPQSYGYPSLQSPSFKAAPDMANAAIIAATGLDPKFANQSYAQMASIADTAYGLPAGTMTRLINKENQPWNPALTNGVPGDTIMGLTQMTDTARREMGIPNTTAAKLNPMNQIFGGAAYLNSRPGTNIAQQLGNYYGSKSPALNRAYAMDVLDNPTTPRSAAAGTVPDTQIASADLPAARTVSAYQAPGVANIAGAAAAIKGTPLGNVLASPQLGMALRQAPTGLAAYNTLGLDLAPSWASPAMQAVQRGFPGAALSGVNTAINAPSVAGQGLAQIAQNIPAAQPETTPGVQPGTINPVQTADVSPNLNLPAPDTGPFASFASPAAPRPAYSMAKTMPAGRPGGGGRIAMAAMPAGLLGGGSYSGGGGQAGLLDAPRPPPRGKKPSGPGIGTWVPPTWLEGGGGGGNGGGGGDGGGGKGNGNGGGKGGLYGQGNDPYIKMYGGVPGMESFEYGGLPLEMLKNPERWGLDPVFARQMLRQRSA